MKVVRPVDRRRREHGFVLVYFALCLVVLMAAAGFCVDLGAWYARSAQLQRAADAAAMAGVPWMPNDFATAQKVALATAKANGMVSGSNGITVTVTADPTSQHRLDVSVKDSALRTYFTGPFVKNLTETRSAVAEYQLPIPLGSPQNEFGCASGSACGSAAANVWLAVSGYCAPREQGDLYSAFYDGNYSSGSGGTTYCQVPGTTAPPSPAFANPEYRSSGYTYDYEIAGTNTTPPTVTQDVTVEIYDPSYDCPESGSSTPGDTYSGSTSPQCGTTTTNWVLSEPGPNALDYSTDVVVAKGVFSSGNTLCNLKWCALYTAHVGDIAGRYRLNIYTSANEAKSIGTNQFSLRAKQGDVTGFTNAGPSVNTTPVVDSAAFTVCTTVSGASGYSATCPEVHGEDAMSIYANGAAGSGSGCHLSDNSANGCAVFYLAQVDSAYSGKTLEIDLFDPGEGAIALHLLQPDGSLATFSYTTNDASIEGGTTPPTYSGSGVTCVCDIGSSVTALPGRVSSSKYNDRILQIDATVPSGSAVTSNGGWYKIEYDFNGGNVTDRTTWSATILQSPVHLVQ